MRIYFEGGHSAYHFTLKNLIFFDRISVLTYFFVTSILFETINSDLAFIRNTYVNQYSLSSC